MNARKRCRNRSSVAPRAGLFLLAVACLWHSPALAADDECGGLKVPGYTAKRITGKVETRAAVTADKERTEQAGEGPVHIMEFATRTMTIINPKTKVAVIAPPPPPPNPKQKAPERITTREPEKDGIVKVTLSLKTPRGTDWVVQTSCRVADGIWVERKVKTPQGIVETRQTDIKAEAIPASDFEVPKDYKVVKPPAK